MRIDDICSPGFVPNSHRLRQETVRAIAFCETIGSVEKAVELQKYFREAIEYLDREIVSSGLPESEHSKQRLKCLTVLVREVVLKYLYGCHP